MNYQYNRFKKLQPAVIGILKDHRNLNHILEDLHRNHFTDHDISIQDAKLNDINRIPHDNYVLESVFRGLTAGIVVGLFFGLLLSSGFLPGASTFVTAGPIVSVAAGISIGINVGGLSGAVMGFLVNIKVARIYNSFIKDKGAIISVHAEDPRRQLAAKNILVNHGAVEILNPAV